MTAVTGHFCGTTPEYPDLIGVVHDHDGYKPGHEQGKHGNGVGRIGGRLDSPGFRNNVGKHRSPHGKPQENHHPFTPQQGGKVFLHGMVHHGFEREKQDHQEPQSPYPPIRTGPFCRCPGEYGIGPYQSNNDCNQGQIREKSRPALCLDVDRIAFSKRAHR